MTNALAAIILAGTGSGDWLLAWPYSGVEIPVWSAGFAFAPALAMALLGRTGVAARLGWKTLAGMFVLGALVIPALTFAGVIPAAATSPFGIPLGFPVVGLLALALVISGLLLHTALTPYRPWTNSEPQAQPKTAHRSALIAAVLLTGAIYFTLYWLMVWDSTYDPIGAIWLAGLVLIAVITGILLAIIMAGRPRIAGLLFAIVVPACLIFTTARAQDTGFRTLTAERAERVSLALESFHDHHGRYPDSLRELVPGHILFVPPPVVIFGQAWCYDAGGDFYRLGYVDREHWSDPRLIGRLYKTTGQVQAEPALCAAQISDLMEHYPDYFVEIDGAR